MVHENPRIPGPVGENYPSKIPGVKIIEVGFHR